MASGDSKVEGEAAIHSILESPAFPVCSRGGPAAGDTSSHPLLPQSSTAQTETEASLRERVALLEAENARWKAVANKLLEKQQQK